MIKSTTELFQEVLEDTDDLIEYVLSSSGDPNLSKWLLDLKTKIAKLYGRTVSPITQQEPEKHIPSNPYKKNPDFEEVKSCIKAGKLPPLGSAEFGIQYINSKK